MLVPKKLKYRKPHRGRMRGRAKGGTDVQFGEYGLQALEPAWITNRQIEAARIAMTRKIRRGGKVWINIFPHKPVTKKPAETRMGSGKGSPEAYVAVVKPGRVMFEMSGVDETLAREAMNLAAQKLPIKTRFLRRGVVSSEGSRSARAGRRGARAAPRRHKARALQPALPARNRTVGEHGTAQRGQKEYRQDPDGPEPESRRVGSGRGREKSDS